MFSNKATFLIAGTCVALALAACSGSGTGGSAVPNASGASAARHGWMLPLKKKEPLLYVTDYTSSIVLIYEQGDTGAGPIGEITDGISGPEGDAVDKSGTLYVANNANNTVTEYPAGSTSPSVTLSTDLDDPLSVSVDSNGILYVAEPSQSKILEFEPGSTSPNATASLSKPEALTNARNDDLYVSYNVSGSGGHAALCKPLATTCKDLGITVELAQGIAVDLQGNLLIGDYFAGDIDIYHRKATTPFRTILTPYEQPFKLALDKTDATLYMADPANFAVELYNYSAGTQQSSFTFGSADELLGVALSPGQKPGR
jgi:sugar lactone lactonase YvrE